MNHNSSAPRRLIVVSAALAALIACNSLESGESAEGETRADSGAVEVQTPEIRTATGTVKGMALAYPKNEEKVKLTIVYIVKLDDGTEVSAKPPYREKSETTIGTVKSDDTGKRVELESIIGEEAQKAQAAWRIVRFTQ